MSPARNSAKRIEYPMSFCAPAGAARPGGDEGARTPDIRLAKAALSQLSYIPKVALGQAGCARSGP